MSDFTKIKNTQKISFIEMHPIAFTKCQIGQDWYKNKLSITFIPRDVYPDYMDIDKWIREKIDGHELNIEDVVSAIYDFIRDEYNPKDISVRDDVSGCKTHFDVTVVKK